MNKVLGFIGLDGIIVERNNERLWITLDTNLIGENSNDSYYSDFDIEVTIYKTNCYPNYVFIDDKDLSNDIDAVFSYIDDKSIGLDVNFGGALVVKAKDDGYTQYSRVDSYYEFKCINLDGFNLTFDKDVKNDWSTSNFGDDINHIRGELSSNTILVDTDCSYVDILKTLDYKKDLYNSNKEI